MNLYWLQPGWASARCACGAHIQGSRGDPDWGQCYGCFSAMAQQQQYDEDAEREYWASHPDNPANQEEPE